MASRNHEKDIAHFFHEVTKHSYTSVRSDGHMLDWENRPLAYKIYPQAGALALPRDLELSARPALETIVGGEQLLEDGELTARVLARLLFCAGGLTRSRRMGDETYHFRAAASAGALYPIEIYLAAGEVEDVEPGLYHFSPADLKLRGLRTGDQRGALARVCDGRSSVAQARAVVVLSSIYWRSTWKYRARAYRYCFWDAGMIAANLLAATAAEGLQADVVTLFVDSELEALLGVDGITEGVNCLITLGRTQATTEHATSRPDKLELETVPLSRDSRAYEDLARIQAASRLEEVGELSQIVAQATSAELSSQSSGTAGDAASLISLPALHSASLSLGDTILRRGSTRHFTHAAVLSGELGAILDASSAPVSSDVLPMVHTYLIINGVEGLEPGAFYHDQRRHALERLRTGDLRAEAGYLCLEQPLGADCAALLVYMASLEKALSLLGNRAYRTLHLEAGIRGGRAYLAAYSLGRGATGLTFYDDDTTALFSPHGADMSPLLMVAVGVPRLS
ncbi:MAG: SagB/ThcOx family dehydrogenase [Candidatus Binataceae bacterium]